MSQEYDDISKMENHETSKKLPIGWLLMSALLVIFAVFYVIAYTPAFSGWKQTDQYEEALKDM